MMESWMEVIPPTPPHLANRFLSQSRGGAWTQEENKAFEEALARFDRESPHRWARVAAAIPGKTEGDVFAHYQELESDVSSIESGVIPFPSYSSGPDPDPTSTSTFTLDWDDTCCLRDSYGKRSGGRGPDQERKKGVPWTEKEHKYVFNYFLTLPSFLFFSFLSFFLFLEYIYLKKKKKKEKKKKKKLHVLFLLGLKKYGRGDWRNISRNFVTSRTPTQVASHAQKYFIRLNSGVKDKRRSSIHDITTVNLPDDDDPPPPSPSLPPAVVTVSSSPAPSSTAISDQISMIVDSKRHNEAAGSVLNSSARSNPYAQSAAFGIDLYGLKLESQDLPREILNDSFVRW